MRDDGKYVSGRGVCGWTGSSKMVEATELS